MTKANNMQLTSENSPPQHLLNSLRLFISCCLFSIIFKGGVSRTTFHRNMSLFPDPRRIVTGHNESGRSIVIADSTVPCEPTPVKCNFAVLYETHQFPESNDNWVDPIEARTKSLANDKGVVLRVVDFPPNTETVSRVVLTKW
jgi:hypothetical protein